MLLPSHGTHLLSTDTSDDSAHFLVRFDANMGVIHSNTLGLLRACCQRRPLHGSLSGLATVKQLGSSTALA